MAAPNRVDVNGDEALMKRILATHKHLDLKEFDSTPLLHSIDDVIQHAKGTPVQGGASASEGHLRYNLLHLPYEAIKSVSCECSGASTTSDVAIGVLQSLGSYSWEAKAVITLAAFAANYGSYFSISQLYGNNDLFSKSTAFLQLSPGLLKQTPLKLKPQTLKVVGAILDLASYIVEIKAFQSKYVQRKNLASFLAAHEDHLAKAVYVSIQSTVACASILMKTVALGNEYKPTIMEVHELSELEIQLKDIRSTLTSEMASWRKHIELAILLDDYEKLVRLFKREHIDNTEILQALLCWNQIQSTSIYNCSTKMQEELNKLSGKYVLLYFSNLQPLSKEEISILKEKYVTKVTECQIVWVPIVDESTSWSKDIEKYFKEMRDSMAWYSINDPRKLNKAVIKYIKEVWKFEESSEFVVLNPKGEFVISATVNLFWFLERSRFQVNYWKTIQVLQETLGSIADDWIKAENHIILFGGKDKDWIEKFVDEAQEVAEDAEIGFVMMYAGKRDLKWADYQDILVQLQKDNTAVFGFGEQKRMSSFWVTLQSIWHTEIKTGKSIVDSSTMEDIVSLLTFDASGEGWAAICLGSSPEMAKARGNTILDILKDYGKWKGLATQDGFLKALVQTIPQVKTTEGGHDCYNLEVAATTGSTPKKVKCRLCERAMKTFIAYRCCGDY